MARLPPLGQKEARGLTRAYYIIDGESMPRLAVALLLLAILPARANLGETLADCVKRYGKPLAFTEAGAKSPFGTLIFIAGPYQMIIFLSNGVEVGARDRGPITFALRAVPASPKVHRD